MMRALLCSGQGLISRGMFDILAANDDAKHVFGSAAMLLGQDPLTLVAEAGQDALTGDRVAQLLCVTRSLSAAAALRLRVPAVVAGYSVGEMAAWSISGLLSPEQALRLTARRAELMDEADEGAGGLGFVHGLDEPVLNILLTRHACALAIRNPGKLSIIGGVRSNVAACCDSALRYGAVAARPLAIRVASHTPRLAAAVLPFEQSMAAAQTGTPDERFLLFGAATARIIRAGDRASVSGLAQQLASTVDWDAVLTALVERGVQRVLELGPGDALAHMVRGAWPDVDARALDDFNAVDGARQWFEAA